MPPRILPAGRPQFVVLEATDGALARAAVQEAARGTRLVPGFRPGPGARASVCYGSVTDEASAAEALLAAIAGAGLIVEARAPRDLVDRLVDDLRRLGSVDHRHGRPEQRDSDVAPPDGLAILSMLAGGASLGDAARVLGVSRRTADRRLAEVRRHLGAGRTAEAVARARERGWLRRGGPPGPSPGLAPSGARDLPGAGHPPASQLHADQQQPGRDDQEQE